MKSCVTPGASRAGLIIFLLIGGGFDVRGETQQPETSELSVDADHIPWSLVSPNASTLGLARSSALPGCERKWLVTSSSAKPASTDTTPIRRADLRMGLMRLLESRTCTLAAQTYTQIFYVIEGEMTVLVGDEAVLTGEAHVLRIPPGRSIHLEANKESKWVVYAWAPGGKVAALHAPSTMTELVDIPNRVRRSDVALTRYQPFSGTGFESRFHVRASDIGWTTNWTYDEALWSVYRYKPLVREPLDAWRGIRQDDVRMGLQELEVGAAYPAHHHASPEIYFVLTGRARWTVDGQTIEVGKGTAIYTPSNAVHRIESIGSRNGGPLRWLYLWWAPDGDPTSFVEASH